MCSFLVTCIAHTLPMGRRWAILLYCLFRRRSLPCLEVGTCCGMLPQPEAYHSTKAIKLHGPSSTLSRSLARTHARSELRRKNGHNDRAVKWMLHRAAADAGCTCQVCAKMSGCSVSSNLGDGEHRFPRSLHIPHSREEPTYRCRWHPQAYKADKS